MGLVTHLDTGKSAGWEVAATARIFAGIKFSNFEYY